MFLQEKVNEINNKLRNLENISNIVIWGAGIHTCKPFERTNLLSYAINSIVDMDERKQGRFCFGFIIKNPQEMIWEEVGGVIISVPGKEKQIAEELTDKLGFKGTIIYLYEDSQSTPFYRLYDEGAAEVQYLGDYAKWEDAESECDGYDHFLIFNKVVASINMVLEGKAAWERDGYLFYEKKYVYPLCAAILKCALQNDNKGVRILDVGGALGSTYFQNKEYLADIKNLEYVIAEQEKFAEYGHANLENDVLHFIDSRVEFSDYGKFDIILMSASLQYVFAYKEMISKVIAARPRYIILDRILVSNRMRVCKELVPEQIYKGSYPVWIYSEEEIMELLNPNYVLVERDCSSVPEEAYFADGKADSKLYVFRIAEEDSVIS